MEGLNILLWFVLAWLLVLHCTSQLVELYRYKPPLGQLPYPKLKVLIGIMLIAFMLWLPLLPNDGKTLFYLQCASISTSIFLRLWEDEVYPMILDELMFEEWLRSKPWI